MNMICLCAAFIAVCVLLIFARSEWERRELRAEHYKVSAGKIRNRTSAGGSPVSGVSGNGDFKFKIAFFSDVHNYYNFNGTERILKLLKEEAPDAVLLGGDLFTYSKEENTAFFLNEAVDLAVRTREICDTVYVPGNHEFYLKEYLPDEYAKFRNTLENAGVYYLEDGKMYLSDGRIAVYGVSLDEVYYKHCLFTATPEMPEKYLIGKCGLPEKNCFNILVAHNPLYLEEYAAWGADLALSGHFHGGTVNIPRLGGLMTPQYQFFYKRCGGMHRCGDTTMVVNRGLGTHSVNLRLNDLPEVSLIDLS